MFSALLLFSGCKTYHWNSFSKELEAMHRYRSWWQYNELDTIRELNILFYQKEVKYPKYTTPPFIIGTTAQNNDTLAVIPGAVYKVLKPGETITIVPHKITTEFVCLYRPHAGFFVYEDHTINELHRVVKHVYWAEIK